MAVADYGAFAPIVSAAGTIIAMGTALRLGWKGRAKWEPVEEDVPRAPQKVASLAAALCVVVIWAQLNDIQFKNTVVKIVIWSVVSLIVSLVAYGLLNGLVYKAVRKEKGTSENSTSTKMVNVIGGLWLKKEAKEWVGKPEFAQQAGQPPPQTLTVQRMFGRADYEKDVLWSRLSQQLASMLFTLGYIGLIISGTVALGSGAILTGLIIRQSQH